tara:strand:- start:440 stop:1540 length:1101 start_codon:yes stop_codon:yes gene_type:complete
MNIQKVVILIFCFACTSVFAGNMSIEGTIKKTISLDSNKSNAHGILSNKDIKQISLLKIKLSSEYKDSLKSKMKVLKENNKFAESAKDIENSFLSSKVDLGMNETPVLDQGNHGSCATFAVTGALDAIAYQDDHISQLCLLQLGQYLSENSNFESGWEGDFLNNVLSKIKYFGTIGKEHEKFGCGGLTSYPSTQINKGSMNLEDYRQKSENIFEIKNIKAKNIINVLESDYKDLPPQKVLLEKLKKELDNSNRIILGLLLANELKTDVSNGKFNYQLDSWVVSDELADKILSDTMETILGGHAMVIIGYDDSAIAVDEKGKKHKGLFKLRNSWGSKAGDKGDYYVSYDYLAIFIIEAYSITNDMNK